MLSFFSKKRQSDSPTDDIIQGPVDPAAADKNTGDDFIFVEKKTPPEPSNPSAVYPAMPVLPYPVGPPGMVNTAASSAYSMLQQTPYIQGVPFELAPELCLKNTYEITQMEVDGILAFLTRQMSIDEQEGYTFQLERSVQSEVC